VKIMVAKFDYPYADERSSAVLTNTLRKKNKKSKPKTKGKRKEKYGCDA
jgi:hypothetical protein